MALDRVLNTFRMLTFTSIFYIFFPKCHTAPSMCKIRVKVLKNRQNKICGRQSLKNFK